MANFSNIEDFLNEAQNECSWNKGLSDLLSENPVFDDLTGRGIGHQACKHFSLSWANAFPDWQHKASCIEKRKNAIIAEITAYGTHTHPFNRLKTIKSNFCEISEFGSQLESLTPTGKKCRIKYNATFIFSGKYIDHIILSNHNNPDICSQLGISFKNSSKRESLNQNLEFLKLAIKKNGPHPSLTYRELECIAFAMSGFTAKQHAMLANISYRTIQTHLTNAYDKLGCFNRLQCVEMMYTKGYFFLWQNLCRLFLQMKYNRTNPFCLLTK